MTHDELANFIRAEPELVRSWLSKGDVVSALSEVGVLPKVLELHAPAQRSKKRNGLGETLCGIRGTRHEIVTCTRCLRSLAR